jgi:hypothetical protein
MTTYHTTPGKFRRAYVRWDRCEETGRRIGIWFVVFPLYILVRLHRPTPLEREWAGLLIGWKGETLIDTFPVPK